MRATEDNVLEEPSDDELMQAYAAGDPKAFEGLFARHQRSLHTFFLHQTGDRAVAEDLFQEVFLRLIRRVREYRPNGNFRAWLWTIAHHALTDQRRRAAVRDAGGEPAMTELDSEPTTEGRLAAPAATAPLARVHARELRAHIEAALQRLPEAQREVFLLRERAGLELARIAEVTGANVSTVKSRLRYALEALRRQLELQLTSLPETLHE
jgi:RNA polymerase sigma-70 factor (ECF subfamily)